MFRPGPSRDPDTQPRTSETGSWEGRLRDAARLLRAAASDLEKAAELLWLRILFGLGRASFLKASVRAVQTAPAKLLDAAGHRSELGLLAHYELETEGLHKGRTGFERLERELARHRFLELAACLRCPFCHHRYVVALAKGLAQPGTDPPARSGAAHEPPGAAPLEDATRPTQPDGAPPESQIPRDLVAHPASYSCTWFRFWRPEYPGEPQLDCSQCEQKGKPKVTFL